MEQRDYILREIEKIGMIMNAIRQLVFGGSGTTAVFSELQHQEAKEMLFDELHFDLNLFLQLEEQETTEYLVSIVGFNQENIEKLAEIISEIGFSLKNDHRQIYLCKALLLYEYIAKTTKTFSFDRETRIEAIKRSIRDEEKDVFLPKKNCNH